MTNAVLLILMAVICAAVARGLESAKDDLGPPEPLASGSAWFWWGSVQGSIIGLLLGALLCLVVGVVKMFQAILA
jgi:hypothetical protein